MHRGLYNRSGKSASPAPSPTGAHLSTGRKGSPHRGGRENVEETGHLSGPQGACSQRLSLPTICSPQKRWGDETNNQPKGVELIRTDSALQNGGHSHGERYPKTRRLDDQSRPEGCIFHDSDCTLPEGTATISVAGDHLPVQLPAIWPVVSPMGLYQDHEANSDNPQVLGPKDDHIHRRHPDHGRLTICSKGAHSCSDLPSRKSRFHSQLPQIPSEPHTGNRNPGLHSELCCHGNQSAGQQNQTSPLRGKETPGSGRLQGHSLVTPPGQTEPCCASYPPSTPVLQEPTILPSEGVRNERGEGLLSASTADSLSNRGVEMVAATPYQMEWAGPDCTEPRPDDRDRCLHSRVGSTVSGHKDRRALVAHREDETHKLPGATGSHSCSEVFCQRQTEHHNPPEGGQHDSHGIHKQVWGNSLPRTEPAHERVVAVVPGEEYKSTGHPLSGHPELHSRRGVPGDEGQDRLDALSTCVQQDMSADRPTTSGSLCVTPDQPAEQLRQLETRSGSSGNRRLFPRLDTVPGVCKPTMELGGKGPVSCQEPEGRCGVSSTGVEITSMVPHATGNVGSTTTPLTRQTKPNPADSQSQQARHNPHTSRMGYLRDRFQSQKLSEGATTLLLASWREKTAKSYDSLFSKWISWCNERGSDPISGDIHEVVNFLAHLFQQGYQYRSLNSYRSAISSVHEKVDGYEVGQHPLVTRLIKGAFHERPPQPRYSATWDVSQVTAYLESMGNNDNLPNDQLTHKTVILLALTRPSRSTDLANLDLDHRRYSPEGVTFIPTKLAKQSKQSKPLTEFFFPCFPGNKLLCPVTTLRAYEERTKGKRGDHNRAQLFIALIKPHNPVTSPTIARWIRTILSKAGIDTDTFKAHSTRSAAVSTAASIGLTTNDILNAADWSSESVFRKFYYRPEAKNTFGIAVLSKQATTKS